MDITLDFKDIKEDIVVPCVPGGEITLNLTLMLGKKPYTPKNVNFEAKYREHGKYRGTGQGIGCWAKMDGNVAAIDVPSRATLKPMLLDCVITCDDEYEYPLMIDVED